MQIPVNLGPGRTFARQVGQLHATTRQPVLARATSPLMSNTGIKGAPERRNTRRSFDTGASAPLFLEDLPAADLATVLTEVESFVRRFVVFSNDYQLVAITLWVAHTHIFDQFECTAYLHITSPHPESGKSRLLEVVEPLVARPWMVTRP
jgi:hypothetical protein